MIVESNKQQLYWLIDLYLEKKIDTWLFCHEYHNLYDLGMGQETLSSLEAKVFNTLSEF